MSVDFACVIHGNKYDWIYVERLYNMIKKNTSFDFRFHVFTEHDRAVPGYMHKHVLEDWPGISGPKKSWWYKLQMFDSRRLQTRLLYFDLDVLILDNLDWLWANDAQYLWTLHDFKFLWKPNWLGMNSSLMLWDTVRFDWIWQDFRSKNIEKTTKEFHGDQDYLTNILGPKHIRFLSNETVKSWRWQVKDGGFDMKNRAYRTPNSGSVIDADTKILVFHGRPKPHEINDPIIDKYWYLSV